MRRDELILIGLFALLAAFIALGPARSASDPAAGSHSSHSSGPDGALALYRWLAALGYKAADADQAVRRALQVLGANATTEQLIKKALAA